jgi:uncharacterized membrane protein YhaH (DUF805 family)
MGKYFSFKGEVNRKQFWLTILLGFVLNVIASMILQMVTGSLIMGMLPGFVWFYVILTTSVKSLREMGKPELLVLLYFIPLIGFLICLLWFGFAKPQKSRT